MNIVGTKYCGHDSALCLINTSKRTIFAVSTERVTRIKHDFLDISPILDEYDINDIDTVAHSYNDFSDVGKDGELRAKMTLNKEIEKALREIIKPKYIKDLNISRVEKNKLIYNSIFTNFNAVKKYYFSKFKRAFIKDGDENFNKEVFTKYIRKTFGKRLSKDSTINFYEHHLCHALPSYFLSPFYGKEAIALTLDGQGDGYFSKLYKFSSSSTYELIGESSANYLGDGDKFLSIGRIYNYFTQAMDLRPNSDEGKVEARAAFGIPDKFLLEKLKRATIIDKKKLSINFDIKGIRPFYDIAFLKKERKRIGDPSFCAVVQTYLEDTVVDYLHCVYKQYPIENLCISGGVAANIIMSLSIYEKTSFKKIYVLPPMGDEGLALGSAIKSAIDLDENITWIKDHYMPYFGDEYSRAEVKNAIYQFDNIEIEDLEHRWHEEAAKSVAEGKICSFFHGKMEFGPRALGNRSIVANPMLENSRDKINSTVKRRPSYQPFCPSILEEDRKRLFKDSFQHKHMAIAFRMKDEHIKNLPCAVHIDGTARPQFVEEKDNPNYYRYLKELKKLTGYGVSLNTSFNLHGRTIVRTPSDAIIDFIDCNIDEMFIEGYRVKRKNIEN